MADLILRDLSGIAEFLAAEALQRAVWGHDDLPDPGDLMMVIQAEGGLCAGAFQDGRLVGYVFGFPTRQPAVQHSHRLAVLPDMRGTGLGARLKWYQRDWCLARDITLVRWTFDPMRRTNANLNIGHLGGSARTYHADYYGEMKGINAGVPSDRLLVEWRLDDVNVALRARRKPPPPPEAPFTRQVPIPPDFADLLANRPEQALAERLRVRSALTAAFDDHEEITGFDRLSGAYLLQKRAD